MRAHHTPQQVYSRRRGFPARFGYNLTANTSGGCPECGTKIAEVRRA
jgi:hypothetical protein